DYDGHRLSIRESRALLARTRRILFLEPRTASFPPLSGEVRDTSRIAIRPQMGVMREPKTKRKSPWDRDPAKIAAAEAVPRGPRALLGDPDRLLRLLAEGATVHLPRRSDLGVVASVFQALHRGDYARGPVRPDAEALRRLLLFCRGRTDLLTDQEAYRFA